MLPCHREIREAPTQAPRECKKGRIALAIALICLAALGAAFYFQAPRAKLCHFFSKTLPNAYKEKQTAELTLALGLPLIGVGYLFGTHKWEKKEVEDATPVPTMKQKRKTGREEYQRQIFEASHNPEKSVLEKLSPNQLFDLYFWMQDNKAPKLWKVYSYIETVEPGVLKDAKLEYILAYTEVKGKRPLRAELLHRKYNAKYLCELYDDNGIDRRSVYFAIAKKDVEELALLELRFINSLPNQGAYEGLRDRVLEKRSKIRWDLVEARNRPLDWSIRI